MTALAKRRALEADLAEIFVACHDDPALFATAVLKAQLKGWQRKALNRIRRRLLSGRRHVEVLCRCCHGAGKTYLAAILVLWYVSTRPGARCLTTGPSWSAVENYLWPEIRALYNGSLLGALRLGEMLDTRWKVSGDTWYAVGAASDQPENLEGHHSPSAALRVVDEAKAVEDGIFDSTAGMLDAPETLDVWISTPSIEAGRFWSRDTKAGPGVIRAVVTVDDLVSDPESTPEQRAAKAAWKDKCARDWGVGSELFQARCMARYLQNAEGALFPGAWLAGATSASWAKSGDPVLGLDCAGSEDGDESTIMARYGPDTEGRGVSEILDAWRERDTTLTVGRALKWARERKAVRTRVDVIGLGKGIHDSLAIEAPAEEYRASDPARDKGRFTNRKAEDAWALRSALEAGTERLTGPPALLERLVEQARSMRYEITRDGRIRVVDPTPSPDLVDAWIISRAPARPSGAFTPTVRRQAVGSV